MLLSLAFDKLHTFLGVDKDGGILVTLGAGTANRALDFTRRRRRAAVYIWAGRRRGRGGHEREATLELVAPKGDVHAAGGCNIDKLGLGCPGHE